MYHCSDVFPLMIKVFLVIFRDPWISVSSDTCRGGVAPETSWYRKMHEFKVTLNGIILFSFNLEWNVIGIVDSPMHALSRYSMVVRAQQFNSWCINYKKHCDNQRKNTTAMIHIIDTPWIHNWIRGDKTQRQQNSL